MVYSVKGVLLFLFLSQISLAQSIDSIASVSEYQDETSINDTTPVPNAIIIKPTVGLGVGMFNFLGDLNPDKFQKPTVSRIAYDLSVSQALSKSLSLNFYVLFGKLGANERQSPTNRNLNFESEIRAGGLSLSYNFDNLLPSKRSASPYISIGLESFEFLSKTDAYDQYGNEYFYWTDGSIRNIDENEANASSAIEIARDYTYESDIREMELDSFGKYPERSFAIPIGIGVIFEINDYLNFRIGTSLHLTFTDYIDGVTSESLGNRVGDSKNDKFVMTSCAISYNFGSKSSNVESEDAGHYKDVDFLALEQYDFDEDGVADMKDKCQGTPIGVEVDTAGCPLDDDLDNYPNYKDDEVLSPADAFVNTKGVELTPEQIEENYNRYIDSTMAFASIEYKTHSGVKPTLDPTKKVYSVSLGSYEDGVPADLMTKFLSIQDVSTNSSGNATTYTSGKFNDLESAESRVSELKGSGLDNLKIVYKQNGKYYDATTNEASTSTPTVSHDSQLATTQTQAEPTSQTQTTSAVEDQSTESSSEKTEPDNNNIPTTVDATDATTVAVTAANNNTALNAPGVVLRVQLGAFKKPVSKSIFRGIDDIIEVKTEDGLYKYMSGAFHSFEKAAKHKLEMVVEGYQGAFITAYKGGKRISLKDAGATPAKKGDQLEVPKKDPANKVRKDLVKFKVQVGVFKNQPPSDRLAIFAKLKDITGERTNSGLTRYVVGSFSSYEAANAYKEEIANKYGLTDSFVVALFSNEYISIQEAQLLLK